MPSIGCIFSVPCIGQHIFLRLEPVTRPPMLIIGSMFFFAWHWFEYTFSNAWHVYCARHELHAFHAWHSLLVFPHLALFASFGALGTSCMYLLSVLLVYESDGWESQ